MTPRGTSACRSNVSHEGVSLCRLATACVCCFPSGEVRLAERSAAFKVWSDLLVFHPRCFSVAMTPHGWGSRCISCRRLVNLETADVTRKGNREGTLTIKTSFASCYLHSRNEKLPLGTLYSPLPTVCPMSEILTGNQNQLSVVMKTKGHRNRAAKQP